MVLSHHKRYCTLSIRLFDSNYKNNIKFKTEVSVELLVRAAGRPGAPHEERGEGMQDEGRCTAVICNARGHGLTVRRDIVKEEELLTRGVMPREEGRYSVSRSSSFTCRTGITRHGHSVAKDGLVCLVEVQPLGREGARIMQCYRCGTYG